MQKTLKIQKYLGRTDIPTYRPTDPPTDTARFRVACPRLKHWTQTKENQWLRVSFFPLPILCHFQRSHTLVWFSLIKIGSFISSPATFTLIKRKNKAGREMWLGAFSCVGRQSTQLKFPSLTQLTRVVCIVWLSWMPWIHKMTYDGNNGEWYNWPYQSDWNPLNKVYLSKTVKDRPKVIGHRWTHKHEWRLKSRVEQLDYNHSGTSLTAGAIIMYHNNEICQVSLPEDMIFVALTPLEST